MARQSVLITHWHFFEDRFPIVLVAPKADAVEAAFTRWAFAEMWSPKLVIVEKNSLPLRKSREVLLPIEIRW